MNNAVALQGGNSARVLAVWTAVTLLEANKFIWCYKILCNFHSKQDLKVAKL